MDLFIGAILQHTIGTEAREFKVYYGNSGHAWSLSMTLSSLCPTVITRQAPRPLAQRPQPAR